MGGFTPFADWDDKIVEGGQASKAGNRRRNVLPPTSGVLGNRCDLSAAD